MDAVQAMRLVAWTLRRRVWGSLLVITVIAGAAGGLATGLVAGATRTGTAAERFVRETRLLDVVINGHGLTPEHATQIRRLPQVQGTALLSAMGMAARGGPFVNVAASVDGRYGVDVDVPRIVRGRIADPAAADEMVLNESTAAALDADVGDVVRFDTWSPAQLAAWRDHEPSAEEQAVFLGPQVDFEVVGISRHPADLISDDPLAFFTPLPPGFLRAYSGRVGELGFRFIAVDLGESPTPADEAAVADAAREIVGEAVGVEEAGEQIGPLQTTLDFVSGSMLALAGAVCIAGFVISVIVIVRTVSRAAQDTAGLHPLGMTDRERASAVTIALTPAAICAGALAFSVSVASSAFMPFGLGRRAEPHPGIDLDCAVVVAGAATTVIVVGGAITVAALGVARRAGSVHRVRSRKMLSGLHVVGLPVSALCGFDLALGSDRGSVPAANRSASLGVGLATAVGVVALVLGASMDRLFATPEAYGWTWDVTVPHGTSEDLADDRAVASFALVTFAPMTFDGRAVMTRGIRSLKGEVPLVIVEGRMARAGEVVLGARTMDDLDVGLGDTVVAQGALERRTLRVVGQAVFAGVVDTPEAGWGAAMPQSALAALGPQGDAATSSTISLVDGTNSEAFIERVSSLAGEAPQTVEEPAELARLRETERLPWILAAFMAAVGLTTIAHAVLVTTRRRGADLAILRSMGLARRGVYAALAVQAGVLAILGGVLGLPLGIAAGQALWRRMAGSLGVVVIVDVPWPAIVASVTVACTAISALALLPARSAARSRPAEALRAE